MNEKYGDGSDHEVCDECGFCVTCGDCAKFGCGKITRKKAELFANMVHQAFKPYFDYWGS